MNISAVTISKQDETVDLTLPFYCHTEGYKPIPRDNGNIERLRYITGRYNDAIEAMIKMRPQTSHVFVIDSYYLHARHALERLLHDYAILDEMNPGHIIMGASIWFRDSSRIRPLIKYYDTMSVPEFTNRSWSTIYDLPHGIEPSSGVGACWIFPLWMWETGGGFRVMKGKEMATSRCINSRHAQIFISFDSRLWRSHDDNPKIPPDSSPLYRRIRNTLMEQASINLGIDIRGIYHRIRKTYYPPDDHHNAITMNYAT